jgi:uncharacterized protein YndB with AHSA1/START domain
MESSTTELELMRILPAEPAEVFDAWTRPELMARWFAPPPLVPATVTADARVGGRYEVEMRRPDGSTVRVRGEYLEVVPPERLVFTWEFREQPQTRSEVTVQLRSSEGGTQLRLVHRRLPDATEISRHRHGWEGCFDALARFLGVR